MVVVLAALAMMGLLLLARPPLQTVDRLARAVEHTMTNLPAIAARFQAGTITHTFTSSIPQIAGTDGDILELAVAENSETFRRADSKTILWDKVYLGTTVSEIRVPVTFRYHLRLSDPWRLDARDQVCLVLAPPIRPSLPPAIHTDRMTKSTERGWARFNGDENLADLERSITPTLGRRALDPAHMRLARETCRQSVAAFVRRWLMREDHWRTDRFSSIVVVFPDEVSADSPWEQEGGDYRPTVELEGR
jgi:hypothetical protein